MERDLDMEEDLIAEEANFWKEYVQKKIEPPYIEKPDLVLESIRRHYGPAEKDSETVKLSPKHLQSVNQYLNWKEQRAEAEKEVKRLEEEMKKSYLDIVEELGPNCTGKISSGNKEYMISYNPMSVSYTHLDVYKRQHQGLSCSIRINRSGSRKT